jgi:hypothetical protein
MEESLCDIVGRSAKWNRLQALLSFSAIASYRNTKQSPQEECNLGMYLWLLTQRRRIRGSGDVSRRMLAVLLNSSG